MLIINYNYITIFSFMSSTNLDGTTNIFEPYYNNQKLYIKKNNILPTTDFTYYSMGFPKGKMIT